MIGVIVNVLAVALGGVLGTVFSKKLSTRFTTELNKVFGVCAIGMGISSVPLMQNMPAVILAVVTGIVLFCSSGTGIYGCLDAGMTGNATVLLSKSILDFFTAMVFACNLGAVTSRRFSERMEKSTAAQKDGGACIFALCKL